MNDNKNIVRKNDEKQLQEGKESQEKKPIIPYKEPITEILSRGENPDPDDTYNPFGIDISGKKDYQHWKWQLTINNPQKYFYDNEKITAILVKKFKTLQFFCKCEEKGSTYHMHIFIVFCSRVRFSTIKNCFPEAHIVACMGDISANVDYIKKTGKWKNNMQKQEQVIEGTYYEWGIQPSDNKGTNPKWAALHDMILMGYTDAQILEINHDYLQIFEKLGGMRTKLLSGKFKEKNRDVEVIYVSGPTGVGKTYNIYNTYGYPNVWRVTDYKNMFDNYSVENVMFFDEFRNSVPLTNMLNYIQGYPLDLPARYHPRTACYTKVYIVSNWELERQYEEEQSNDIRSYEAFIHRISKVIIYTGFNEYKIYNSVEEYFKRDK